MPTVEVADGQLPTGGGCFSGLWHPAQTTWSPHLSLVLCRENLALWGRPQETLQVTELLIFLCDGHTVLLLHPLLLNFPRLFFHSTPWKKWLKYTHGAKKKNSIFQTFLCNVSHVAKLIHIRVKFILQVEAPSEVVRAGCDRTGGGTQGTSAP